MKGNIAVRGRGKGSVRMMGGLWGGRGRVRPAGEDVQRRRGPHDEESHLLDEIWALVDRGVKCGMALREAGQMVQMNLSRHCCNRSAAILPRAPLSTVKSEEAQPAVCTTSGLLGTYSPHSLLETTPCTLSLTGFITWREINIFISAPCWACVLCLVKIFMYFTLTISPTITNPD